MLVRFEEEKILIEGTRMVKVRMVGCPYDVFRRNLIISYLDVGYQIVVHFNSVERALQYYDYYSAKKWLETLRDYNNIVLGESDKGKHMTLCSN